MSPTPRKIFLLTFLIPNLLCAPLPAPSPNNGLGIAGNPFLEFGLIRGSKNKREASPQSDLRITGAPFFEFGLKRGIKDKRAPSPSPKAENGFGISVDPSMGFGLTEDEKREAAPQDNLGIEGAPSFEFRLTKDKKRDASPEPQNNIGIEGAPSFEFGLTEDKREASPSQSRKTAGASKATHRSDSVSPRTREKPSLKTISESRALLPSSSVSQRTKETHRQSLKTMSALKELPISNSVSPNIRIEIPRIDKQPLANCRRSGFQVGVKEDKNWGIMNGL